MSAASLLYQVQLSSTAACSERHGAFFIAALHVNFTLSALDKGVYYGTWYLVYLALYELFCSATATLALK